MPKKKNLEESLYLSYKGVSKNEFTKPMKRNLSLEWMNSIIKISLGHGGKEINLKYVNDWEVNLINTHIGPNVFNWEIILREKKGCGWKIMGKEQDDVFYTWLYWIMTSLIKHSEPGITRGQEEKLVKYRRKEKIKALRDKREFDKSHDKFIRVVGDINSVPKQGETFSGEGGKKFKDLNIYDGLGQSRKFSILPATWEKTEMEDVPIAIKAVGIKEEEVKPLIKEAKILAAIGEHSNIIRIIDAKAFQNSILIFMEKADMELDKVPVADLKTKTILRIAEGIISGVDQMHNRGIYHLDLKPSNIMVVETSDTPKNYIPKIIDFDMARNKADFRNNRKDVYECSRWTDYGTVGYIPPESWEIPGNLLRKRKDYKPSKSEHLEKRDAYAIGVTFMECLIGPFCRNSNNMIPPLSKNQHSRKAVKEYLNKVKKQIEKEDQKILRQRRLYGLADIAIKMVHPDMDKRITVKKAREEFWDMIGQLHINIHI